MGNIAIVDNKCNKSILPLFSVAISVYEKDNPEWFAKALESVIDQTVKPDEIIIVVDGPVPKAIQEVINKYVAYGKSMGVKIRVLKLSENKGHGIARRTGIKNCRNELIAIMDADDICVSNRFEQQLKFFESEEYDIVGGDIAEFIEEGNSISYRKVPKNHQDIISYMKTRCPMNQVTVMFKKSAVESAGGYRDWYCDEDYYLWLRMYLNKAKFANTGTVLVNVRIGEDMYQRRGGIKYFRSEAKLQKWMLRNNVINFSTYLMNVGKRFIVQVLMPNKVRSWMFKKFARN